MNTDVLTSPLAAPCWSSFTPQARPLETPFDPGRNLVRPVKKDGSTSPNGTRNRYVFWDSHVFFCWLSGISSELTSKHTLPAN